MKTTGRTIRLTDGPTGHFESRYFLLKPRAGFTCLWQCSGFGSGSSFAATLQDAGPPSTAQLADTSLGSAPVGIGGYANLDETDGRVTEQAYNVLVAARRCHWSLTLLFGPHALVRYSNLGLAFSLSFDPSEVSLAPVTPRMLNSTEAKAIGGSSGVLVAFASETQRSGFILSVKAVKAAGQGSTQPAQVEALAGSMTGWQRIGEPQPASLDDVPGYRLGVRWPGSDPQTGAIYVVSYDDFRYELIAVASAGQPQLATSLEHLVGSFRFLGHQ